MEQRSPPKSRSTIKPSVVNISHLPRFRSSITNLLFDYAHKLARSLNRERLAKIHSSCLSYRVNQEHTKPNLKRVSSIQSLKIEDQSPEKSLNAEIFYKLSPSIHIKSKSTTISNMNIIKAQALQAHTKALHSKKKTVCDYLKQFRQTPNSVPENSVNSLYYSPLQHENKIIILPSSFSNPTTPQRGLRVNKNYTRTPTFESISVNPEKINTVTVFSPKSANKLYAIPVDFPFRKTVKQEVLPFLLTCHGAKVYRKNSLLFKGQKTAPINEKRNSATETGRNYKNERNDNESRGIKKWDVKVPCISIVTKMDTIKSVTQDEF